MKKRESDLLSNLKFNFEKNPPSNRYIDRMEMNATPNNHL